MKKAIVIGIILILVIVIIIILMKMRKKSPEQLKKEQRAKCPEGGWWKSDAALKAGFYIPESDPNWNRYGFEPATETCELLGWMTEINMAKNAGKRWPGTDTMVGLAEAAAGQLATQKGRI